jgi:hypothetical protein
VDGAIPFLGGVFVTLMAFRVIGPKPGVNPKQDEWHRRWGGFMRVGGPMLVVFAVFLWVKGSVTHSAPTPQSAWTRYTTADGTASTEFPGPPASVTKEAEGVVNHNVTLSEKERDRHFILSWSVIRAVDGVTDEEWLDQLRDGMPAMTAQRGMPLRFVSEEPYSENGYAGRVFVYEAKGMYLQRMKCLIVNGRLYRATATTPRNPQDEADGVRFVHSFRLAKGNK